VAPGLEGAEDEQVRGGAMGVTGVKGDSRRPKVNKGCECTQG
jgi:hypothetical protein